MRLAKIEATPAAVERIVSRLELLRNSGTNGLAPTLGFAFNYRMCDEHGVTIEWMPRPFFEVWFYKESEVKGKTVDAQVNDVVLTALCDTVARLRGKRLELQTVEIGYPNPSSLKREFLVAETLGST